MDGRKLNHSRNLISHTKKEKSLRLITMFISGLVSGQMDQKLIRLER